ncbi:hypothetical protein LTS18_011225, partial [Coniosporium uncinatum]
MPVEEDNSSDPGSTTSFEQIGREEMHEQRRIWESYVFTELETDQEAIKQYLDGLFANTHKSKKLKKKPLQQLRDEMKGFDDMSPRRFDVDTLETCIKGVLKADVFTGSKREALLDLYDRKTVLLEMSDVLNMDLNSLDSWKWDPSPVPVGMRKQINGKYRVYMDEELHQALLLQFIGSKWAVLMKTAFTKFFHSGAWMVSSYRTLGKKDRQRREYFLGSATDTARNASIRNKRRSSYQDNYFMTQLPSSLNEGSREYNTDDTSSDGDWKTKRPMEIKQSMLRLATTEMMINTKLYGQFTIIQSDFKWFGPSLPHSTIFAVLKFFGVQAKWLKLFKSFLEVPCVFKQDGVGAQGQTRKRGIPMSHILSDALGEAVLFCLDFAVNQRTKGANLYRFHDDLWFWGQESVCVEAWKTLTEFAKVMGLELNEEKTGAAQVFDEPKQSKALPSTLPKGDVRWGFLRLDTKAGRWLIDEDQVDEHVEELRRQLSACRSVFAWVQAFNSYSAQFFSNNFGKPANCFGREHVQMVIETHHRIQRSLFEDGGN